MSRRYYITNFGYSWSLSSKGYLKFLRDSSINGEWNLELPEYEARTVKIIPVDAKPIDITDFKLEHFKEELEYFLAYEEQTGFKAPNDTRRFSE